MLIWILIGLVVGVVMALTGAGAAMASVPLFIHLYGADLKTATALALLASVAGAFFGWFFQRKKTEFKISLTIVFGSLFSSLFLAQFKESIPELIIRILFVAVVTASAVLLWARKKPRPSGTPAAKVPGTLKIILLGLVVGSLTTLTGLAGGLVLVPTLMGPLGLKSDRAVPTSLCAIIMVSGVSLLAQHQRVFDHLQAPLIGALLLGALSSAFLTKRALDHLKDESAHRFRKLLLTFMMIYAALSVLVPN